MQATGWVARRWAQVIGKAPTTWDAIRRRRLIGEAQGDGPVSGQLQQVSPTAWLVGEEPDETAVRSHSQWALVWYRLRHDQTALLGAAIVLFLIAIAIFAPLIAPHNPTQIFDNGLTLDGTPAPPGPTFALGADTLGRDQLSRILYGARVSLLIGIVANGLAVLIGVIVGALGGYFSGILGTSMMRLTDV